MVKRWTDQLEEQLLVVSKMDIGIGNTAVGRYEQRRMEDFKQAAPKFTDEQWSEYGERATHDKPGPGRGPIGGGREVPQ
jgi:hypothetical protein